MRIFVFYLFFSLLNISCNGQNNSAAVSDTLSCSVVRVLDGDTFIGSGSDGQEYKVRLVGIDTPEKDQPFGDLAKEYVNEKLSGQDVKLIVVGLDQYKRILAWVIYTDNDAQINLNKFLVEIGLAWHYKLFKDAELEELETSARNNKIGLWIENNPIEPYLWRKGIRDKK